MTTPPVLQTSSNEEWRDVIGFEGYYRVSSLGNVESLFRDQPRILKPFHDNYGYALVGLSRGRVKRRNAKVHSLVAEAFIGPRPTGLQVNHKNGLKTDNRVENLEYVSPKANTNHACSTGLRDNRGEKRRTAKLKNTDVIEIRKLLSEGVSSTIIGKKFSVTASHIRKINRRLIWKHI